jgi:hypothetical protein
MQNKKHGPFALASAALIVALAALVIGTYLAAPQKGAPPSSEVKLEEAGPGAPKVEASKDAAPKVLEVAGPGTVDIPLTMINSTLKKFTYEIGGKKVRFLAVLGSDGMPRTAIDGCDSCGTSQGYGQAGQDLVCRVCGQHFRIDDLGTGNVLGGGCMPIFLPNKVVGDRLTVKKADLEANANRF